MHKKVAIDLTWVRHKKVGGTESYIRNILNGFAALSIPDVEFVLLVSEDNAASFQEYRQYPCFSWIECEMKSADIVKRVLWQNLKMGALLRKEKIAACFEPINGKPILGTHGLRFYTTIHDLQPLHFPGFFSKGRLLWMKICWWNAIHTSYRIIAISDFVKEDILAHFSVDESRISVIHNIITVKPDCMSDVSELRKYNVEPQKFYYTVSSLMPHKNLATLLKVMEELKRKGSEAFFPLLISGVGGKEHSSLQKMIVEYGLNDSVVFTGFIDNAERDMLYKQCRAFLFPSIFEGFGMPPIEAIALGAPVVTTRETSIPEVTQNLAIYVNDPFSVSEWYEKLEGPLNPLEPGKRKALLQNYEQTDIAGRLVEFLTN